MLPSAQVTKIVATKGGMFYQKSSTRNSTILRKIQRLSQQVFRDAKQIAPPGTGLIKNRLSSPASKEKKIQRKTPVGISSTAPAQSQNADLYSNVLIQIKLSLLTLHLRHSSKSISYC